MDIWRKLEGGRDSLAHALWLLGLIRQTRGELALARSLTEESVEIFRAIGGDDFGLSMSLAVPGIIVLNQEEYALAASLLEESEAVARKMGEDWFLSLPLKYLGAVAFRRGDYDRAALHRESLVVPRESGEKRYISRSIECLASVKAMRGDHARAARLFGAGEAQREATEASRVPFYLVDYDRGVAAAQAGLGKAAFARAWAEGRAITQAGAVEYTLSEDEPARATAPGELPVTLTRSEEEVAALVALGLTNRRVAKRLSISERTVDTHVSKSLIKLGLRSRDEVAAALKPRDPRGPE